VNTRVITSGAAMQVSAGCEREDGVSEQRGRGKGGQRGRKRDEVAAEVGPGGQRHEHGMRRRAGTEARWRAECGDGPETRLRPTTG
jgi:hypothetical protein